MNNKSKSSPLSRTDKELIPILKYIFIVFLFIWFPFVYWGLGIAHPFLWFAELSGIKAALMFISGAIIANATAVGGGMIFNPSLQIIFEVGGYTALVLSILVQSSGMSSGAYGWYKKGEYQYFYLPHLFTLVLTTILFTSLWSILFIKFMYHYPEVLSIYMKIASTCISFYVFWLVFSSIREREQHIELLEEKVHINDVSGVVEEAHILEKIDEPYEQKGKVYIDWRIYALLAPGTILNVTTAVGVGELVFSYLIKYYRAAPKTAIAVGTLMQAVSVLTQSTFILIFLRDLILIDLVCIGILFCAMGGRLAPYILTFKHIEPYAKHILAFTAFAMGTTSFFMVLDKIL